MTRAAVAYENSAEARRKLKSIKHLRWHRTSYGLEAKGARGKYVLVHRSPDRRRGVFPWSLRQGGAKGPELKIGGFDLVSEGKDYASLYDAGLCGAPAQPEGTYRGTMAGETKRSPYFERVDKALVQMGAGGYLTDESPDYVSRMESAGVDPTIVASVLLATHDHRHIHDCPGKHVELSEGASEARRKRSAREAARPGPNVIIGYERAADGRLGDGQFEIYPSSRGWSAEWHPSELSGHQPAPAEALFAPAGDASINGAGAAIRKFLENKFGKREGSDIFYNLVWQRGDYPSGYGPEALLRASRNEGAGEARRQGTGIGPINLYRVYYKDEFGVSRMEWIEAQNEEEALAVAQAEADAHGHSMRSQARVVPAAAEETKKRLWQPDPSTGLFITHSSLTRDWWLMRGDSLEGRFPNRSEAEQAAKDFSKGASEARRPKGQRRQ